MHVWQTLEKDPIFQTPPSEPPTEEMKRRAALQLRKYCQYNFIGPEMANLPYKRKVKFYSDVVLSR